MYKLRTFLAGLLLVAGLSAGFVSAQQPTHIVIAHTNDIHGQLLPRSGVGGMAEMATLIRSMKPDLVLDAGDIFTGTFLSDEFKGEPTIEIMNRLRYTAGTIGNHEFDFGQDVLRRRLRQARFPLLSANLVTPISEIKKYTIARAKGVRFGIIGLTTEELVTTTHPKHLGGVTVLDIAQAVEQVLPEVRRRSDFIILTAHLNSAEEQRIAQAFPEIRLIVGGHVHAALGPLMLGGTMVAKTGNVGRFVGRVDLDFNGRSLSHMEGRLVQVKDVAPATDMTAIITPYRAKVEARMAEVIGEATADLAPSNNSESSLANLIADAYREKGKTQIALQNPGGIRTRIQMGKVTWGNAFEVLPFQNTLITLKLTGTQLKKTLAWDLLAVSGLNVRLDLKKPAGQRLVSATLADGTPIDDSQFYTVTTNDFILAGGDGFSEIMKGAEIKDTGILLRDVFVDYIKSHVVLSPAIDGRIVIEN
jgi:2',3'-cyclic-nucleotide 2'-phosphodiesterase (5'-nucleotidase family)